MTDHPTVHLYLPAAWSGSVHLHLNGADGTARTHTVDLDGDGGATDRPDGSTEERAEDPDVQAVLDRLAPRVPGSPMLTVFADLRDRGWAVKPHGDGAYLRMLNGGGRPPVSPPVTLYLNSVALVSASSRESRIEAAAALPGAVRRRGATNRHEVYFPFDERGSVEQAVANAQALLDAVVAAEVPGRGA